MAHEPNDGYPFPFPSPDPGRSPLQEPKYATHESMLPSLDQPIYSAYPDESTRKPWIHRIRRRVPGPSFWVFILLLAVTGISFCPALLSNKKPFDFIILDGVTPDTSGVKLLGNVFDFNWLDPSKVTVTWSVSGFGNYSMPTAYGYPNMFPPPNIAVDVYVDDPTKPAFSYDPATLPVQFDGSRLPVRSLFTFSMDHEIETGVQFFAPNDLYTFSSFVFAIEKSTNKSIPIISFEIGSSGSGDFGTTSEVVPSANQFTYTGGSGPTTVNVDSHTIFASVGRSVPARALTYSMFAINWVLAVCSIITTSVSFNRGNESTDFGITLLPVTVILTIPAIRNLYVGAPPFGIFLDVVGFFPQMLIVASCTVVVLSGYAAKSVWGKGANVKEKAGV